MGEEEVVIIDGRPGLSFPKKGSPHPQLPRV